MIVSPQKRFKRFQQHHMRPSAFLNQFDLIQLTQSTSVNNIINSESSISIPSSPSKILPTQVSQSQTFLPTIEEKPQITFLQEISDPRESKRAPRFKFQHQESASTNTTLRLPTINSVQNSPQPKLNLHKRRKTNMDDDKNKKVEFRKSIQIIDFINGIITKDVIDGASKPLTKKIQRQQTKFIRQQP